MMAEPTSRDFLAGPVSHAWRRCVGYRTRQRNCVDITVTGGGQQVDQAKKFTTNELIIAGGCVLMIIGYFLKWFAVDFGGGFGDVSVSGSHYFLQGTIPLLLSLVLLAIILVRNLMPDVKLPDMPVPWSQLYLILAGISAVLVLLRLLTGDSDTDRKIGLFLASIGVIVEVVGAGSVVSMPGTNAMSTSEPSCKGPSANVHDLPSVARWPLTHVLSSILGASSHGPASTGLHAEPVRHASSNALSAPVAPFGATVRVRLGFVWPSGSV